MQREDGKEGYIVGLTDEFCIIQLLNKEMQHRKILISLRDFMERAMRFELTTLTLAT